MPRRRGRTAATEGDTLTDIAALGLDIDSSPAARASSALKSFAAAAITAEQANLRAAQAAAQRAAAELAALKATGQASAEQLTAASAAKQRAAGELASARALASTSAANRAVVASIQARSAAEAAAAGVSAETAAATRRVVAAIQARQAAEAQAAAAARESAAEAAQEAQVFGRQIAARRALAAADAEEAMALGQKLASQRAAAAAAASAAAASLENVSATRAEAAALRDAGAAAGAEAAALEQAGAAATGAAGNLVRFNRAANDNIKVARGFQTANIAAQFHDIAVQSALGMNALQIGLQQGTQLAQVFEQMDSPLAGLRAAFLRVISPLSLLTIGFVVLGAALLEHVKLQHLAADAVRAFAGVLQSLVPYLEVAGAALTLLYGPKVVAGIVQLIALMGRLAVQAVITAAALAAANPGTALVLGIALAVAAAVYFRDQLKQIFGFDIVQSAENGLNQVIGAVVGAYNGIVATWRQFPAALEDIGYQAADRFLQAFFSMVRTAEVTINSLVAKINGGLRSIGVGLQLPDLGKPSTGLGVHITNPAAGAAGAVNDQISSAISSAEGKNYVGAVTSIISDGAKSASEKLRELAHWLDTVGTKTKKTHTRRDPYESVVTRAQDRIAAARAEQQGLGLTELAAEKLKDETQLLNEARQRGIDLTPQQTAELKAYADQLAEVTIQTKTAREAVSFVKTTMNSFFSDLRQGIAQGKSFWQAFGSAALNVLDKIVDKINDELATAIANAFAPGALSGASGGGGFFSSLLGGLGSLLGFGGSSIVGGNVNAASSAAWAGLRVASAQGNVFAPGSGGLPQVVPHGNGGVVSRLSYFPMANGGIGSMAEHNRPEAIMPLQRGPSGKLGVASTGGGAVYQDNRQYHIDARYSTKGVAEQIEDRLAVYDAKQLPGSVDRINKKPRRKTW